MAIVNMLPGGGGETDIRSAIPIVVYGNNRIALAKSSGNYVISLACKSTSSVTGTAVNSTFGTNNYYFIPLVNLIYTKNGTDYTLGKGELWYLQMTSTTNAYSLELMKSGVSTKIATVATYSKNSSYGSNGNITMMTLSTAS